MLIKEVKENHEAINIVKGQTSSNTRVIKTLTPTVNNVVKTIVHTKDAWYFECGRVNYEENLLTREKLEILDRNVSVMAHWVREVETSQGEFYGKNVDFVLRECDLVSNKSDQHERSLERCISQNTFKPYTERSPQEQYLTDLELNLDNDERKVESFKIWRKISFVRKLIFDKLFRNNWCFLTIEVEMTKGIKKSEREEKDCKIDHFNDRDR